MANKTTRIMLSIFSATILGVTLSPAAPASAGTHQNGVADYCDFLLYYNSSAYGYGSFSDFSGDSPNLAGYRFLTKASGQGQYVKNNAAAARNMEYGYFVRVYFNSNYSGGTDRVEARQTRNLYYTKNENASFMFAF
jgi:hypothetical protein